MRIDIITIFPPMFAGAFGASIIKRARLKNIVTIQVHDLRRFATDKHKTVDDRPYGGGPGMVLMVEPIDKALKEIRRLSDYPVRQSRTVLTSAKGKIFTQSKARQLAQFDHLVMIAGHYEGVDQRVADHLVDEELSIGNYVLTGGELPVMVMVDAIIRLLPGVLGNPESLTEESFSQDTCKGQPAANLEYPQYTRPESYLGWKVPTTLLSGNHAQIKRWRQDHSK